jgi:hypothetical protein
VKEVLARKEVAGLMNNDKDGEMYNRAPLPPHIHPSPGLTSHTFSATILPATTTALSQPPFLPATATALA